MTSTTPSFAFCMYVLYLFKMNWRNIYNYLDKSEKIKDNQDRLSVKNKAKTQTVEGEILCH